MPPSNTLKNGYEASLYDFFSLNPSRMLVVNVFFFFLSADNIVPL